MGRQGGLRIDRPSLEDNIEEEHGLLAIYTAIERAQTKLLEIIDSLKSGGVIKRYRTSGAVAISLSTALKTDFPGRPWKLRRIEVTWSAAPTTSENLTVTRVAKHEMSPDTVEYSRDPSVGALTSLLQIWDEGGLDMEEGDEVTLAYTNTDANTVKAEIVVEVL